MKCRFPGPRFDLTQWKHFRKRAKFFQAEIKLVFSIFSHKWESIIRPPCCGSHQYFSFQANPPMLYKPAVSQLSWPLVILWFWSGPAPASFCVGPKEASSEQQKNFSLSSVLHSSHYHDSCFSPRSMICITIIRQYTRPSIFSLFFVVILEK